ncbi:MAG: sigma-70 family RNA polymerase sigma factor [Oscillospiraceae bacterium]|nr:sigma-70 family RNA polymerase sigma factor [Oscillospiraceae bacterium]MBR5261407.1 sigma-70 family RNA polymerase sigma factor [Oscillospiraceae bacterium]
MTDELELQTIEKVRRGDADAFGYLVEKHQKLVYNLALKMLGNPEDAEDAAQEAFIKAYRSIESFRGESKFSVWLYKLTNNVCLDMLRKKREATVSLSVEDENGGDDAEIEIADGRFSPDEVYEKKEMREALRKGLSELEDDFRSVLVLREVNGLSYDEIAQTLSLDPGTVKSRIFRARKKLCTILTRDGNFFGFSSSNPKEGGRKS